MDLFVLTKVLIVLIEKVFGWINRMGQSAMWPIAPVAYTPISFGVCRHSMYRHLTIIHCRRGAFIISVAGEGGALF